MSKPLFLIARVVFGAWMLANGVNHFIGTPLYPEPTGHEPMAIQLMAAFQHSKMFDVAMVIEAVTGALILVGAIVPVALTVVMPVSVCAAYWAVVLDHQPVEALLALVAVGLNGLLCLAYLDYYKDMLVQRATTVGEEPGGSYEEQYAYPGGRTAQKAYLVALVIALLVFGFYKVVSAVGLNGQWVMTTLLVPGFVLAARRLHDMGQSAKLLLIPIAVDVVALGWHYADALKIRPGAPPDALLWGAVIVTAAFALWAAVGKSASGANKYGEAAA